MAPLHAPMTSVLELVRCEKAAVRESGTLVPWIDDATDLGFELLADVVQQF